MDAFRGSTPPPRTSVPNNEGDQASEPQPQLQQPQDEEHVEEEHEEEEAIENEGENEEERSIMFINVDSFQEQLSSRLAFLNACM